MGTRLGNAHREFTRRSVLDVLREEDHPRISALAADPEMEPARTMPADSPCGKDCVDAIRHFSEGIAISRTCGAGILVGVLKEVILTYING